MVNGSRSAKMRLNDLRKGDVIRLYVPFEENNLMYLPVTSRQYRHDTEHQYTLQDNSMLVRIDEKMKSHVECDSLRALHVRSNIRYTAMSRGTVRD